MSVVVNVKEGVRWKLLAGSVQDGAVFQEPTDHWPVRVNGETPYSDNYFQSIRDIVHCIKLDFFDLEWSIIYGLEGKACRATSSARTLQCPCSEVIHQSSPAAMELYRRSQ